MKKLLISALGLTFMLTEFFLPAQEGPAPVRVKVFEAVTSEAYTSVMYGARVEPADRFEIRSPLTGSIISFSVKEGSVLKAGDPVFTVRRELSGRNFQALEVTAGRSGTVSVLKFREGDPVTENLPVVTLIDDSSYSMVILVSDRDAHSISTGDTCLLYSDGTPLPVRGKVRSKALEPDYSTGLFDVELSIPRHPSVGIGMFLKAELRKDFHRGIIVETEYLERRYGGLYLPVLKEDFTVEMREVYPLRAYGRKTALAGGLEPGERYVIWSEQRLQDGTPVEVIQ